MQEKQAAIEKKQERRRRREALMNQVARAITCTQRHTLGHNNTPRSTITRGRF